MKPKENLYSVGFLNCEFLFSILHLLPEMCPIWLFLPGWIRIRIRNTDPQRCWIQIQFGSGFTTHNIKIGIQIFAIIWIRIWAFSHGYIINFKKVKNIYLKKFILRKKIGLKTFKKNNGIWRKVLNRTLNFFGTYGYGSNLDQDPTTTLIFITSER